MRSSVLAIFSVCLVACSVDVHPHGEAVLPKLAGDVVATVDGHDITEGEATEFAATHEGATAQMLVEREALARAVVGEADVEFARKRAMVDAFIVDEIEKKVTIDNVPDSALPAHREQVMSDLRAPGGYEVVAVRIYAEEIVRKQASPERREELLELVTKTADRLYHAVPPTNALDAVNSLDLRWVDPAVAVRVLALRVSDPGAPNMRGWSRAPRLAASLADLPDGGRSPLFVTEDSPLFAVRKARIEPKSADDAAIEAAARERALTDVRRSRMEKLMTSLRDTSAIVPHLEVFEEEL